MLEGGGLYWGCDFGRDLLALSSSVALIWIGTNRAGLKIDRELQNRNSKSCLQWVSQVTPPSPH